MLCYVTCVYRLTFHYESEQKEWEIIGLELTSRKMFSLMNMTWLPQEHGQRFRRRQFNTYCYYTIYFFEISELYQNISQDIVAVCVFYLFYLCKRLFKADSF